MSELQNLLQCEFENKHGIAACEAQSNIAPSCGQHNFFNRLQIRSFLVLIALRLSAEIIALRLSADMNGYSQDSVQLLHWQELVVA